VTVLILARDFDPTADAVVQALAAAGVPVFRTDLADFPTRLSFEARLDGGRWTGRLWNAHHSAALDDIRSIWNRGPSTYRFDSELSPQERDFCHREAKLGLGGVLASLDVLWVNHPNRCADAIFKPYQWKIAAECGLRVADTMITNSPAAMVEFTGQRPQDTITKALGPTGIPDSGRPQIAFTRRLTETDLAEPDGVRATATTLQRFVPKAFEVRLTVIGTQLFPVAIHATTDDTRLDWRADPNALTYELVTAPPEVSDAVSRYMKRMNLAYAGVDFVITPDRDWVMLEANTGPQWAWLEAATGAPMVAAMAALLAGGPR
jgi:ATP-grasp ribosomal peptide maturase